MEDSKGKLTKKDILSFFKKTYIEIDVDARARGDDLAMLIYPLSWIIVTFLIIFFNNSAMSHINESYFPIDFCVLLFIILYFAKKYLEKTKDEQIQFISYPKISHIAYGILFSLTLFLLYVLMVRIWNGSLSTDYVFKLFTLFRVVPTEELFFRGLLIFVLINLLGIFNRKKSKKRTHVIWIITIILSGILFGFAHFPRFYDPENFPYFYLYLPFPIRVHMIVPLAQLSILGIMLGWIRMRWGIFFSIMVHFINNLFGTAMIFLFLT